MGVCGALPGHADKFFGNKIVLLGAGHYASYDCKCNTTGTCPEMHDNQIYVAGGKFPDDMWPDPGRAPGARHRPRLGRA